MQVPAERIETAQDGGSIRLAGRELSCYDAPGHEHRQAGAGRRQRLKDGLPSLVLAEARRQGWRLSPERLLAVFREDFELNAQGLGLWLDARRA